jgi:citrate synthase
MLDDPDQKIARPRQVYLGARNSAYVPIAARDGKTSTAKV